MMNNPMTKQPLKITVNGIEKEVFVRNANTLLHTLREDLGLTGAKPGCNNGDCGACTVLIDGLPVNSCHILTIETVGKEITTIEGLTDPTVQNEFINQWAIQCGYCTPGFVLNSYALIEKHPNASDEMIDNWLDSNICRCTGYEEMKLAIKNLLEMRKKVDSMYEIIDKIVDSNEPAILATVIHVEGSAYRKEGATMLFTNACEEIGVISAGCLETDLAIQAKKRLQDDAFISCVIVYDMSAEDDLSWGRGAGCNGKTHILLEKITSKTRNEFRILRQHLMDGHNVLSVRFLQNERVKKICYLVNENEQFGDTYHSFTSIIPTILTKNKSRLEYSEELGCQMYIHYFQPQPRLIIFGAGVDVRPLASIAVAIGYTVTIWDWRPKYCKAKYFPHVTILENHSVADTIDRLHFTMHDSVVIMTHDFQKDKEILQRMLQEKQLSYLGILGPRKRTSRLLGNEQIPNHLHSPVGLSIGAEGPEEIAISIIADLIQTMRKKLNV